VLGAPKPGTRISKLAVTPKTEQPQHTRPPHRLPPAVLTSLAAIRSCV
jgi:hypothetical protein